jgi:hypothetical protein
MPSGCSHPLCKDRNALKYVLPALTKRGEGADNELTRDAVTGIINRLYPDKEQAGPIIEDVLSGKKKLCICKYHFPENSFVPRGPSGRYAQVSIRRTFSKTAGVWPSSLALQQEFTSLCNCCFQSIHARPPFLR